MSGRLDHQVIAAYPDMSRTEAAATIAAGKVKVNGEVQTKAGYKVRPGDSIAINYHKPDGQVENITLPVLYEDDDCIVIDKPVGVLTHSKGAFNPEGTVASWLTARVSGMDGDRAGIVHRLDRATSGVMICAKTPEALSFLQKQFSTRKAKKTYTAIVEGQLAQPAAVIDMPIERNPKKPQTFRVGSNGKSAVTAYTVLKENEHASLLTLKPTTGRTHQLRVHLHHLGHPIIGDTFYGGKPAERLFLHATELEITLPNRQRETFRSPVPEMFSQEMQR